jgi:hypothetical protein
MFFAYPVFPSSAELDQYQEILKNDRASESASTGKDSGEISSMCATFLKKYKKSSRSNDIRFIAIKHEELPVTSLAYCESILRSGSAATDKIKAYLWMCDLLYLTSRYEECADASRKALSLSPAADDKRTLLLLRIRSLLMLQEYDSASILLKANRKILSSEGDLLRSEIVMRTGDGTDPSAANKDLTPSRLYMTARKFEQGHQNDFAFSAYKDLRTKFPRSPEAMVSSAVYATLEKSGAKYSSNYSSKSSRLNFTPEYTVEETPQSLVYAVLIGPVYDLKEAQGIKKEMTPDFNGILLVRGKDGFYLYVGSEPSAEKALALKVRIAEEYALNGKIALKKEESGREYIYGE